MLMSTSSSRLLHRWPVMRMLMLGWALSLSLAWQLTAPAQATQALLSPAAERIRAPHVSLELDLDPVRGSLMGRAVWRLDEPYQYLVLPAGVELEQLVIDGTPVTGAPELVRGWQHWPLPGAAGAHHIEAHWRMALSAAPDDLEHADTLRFVRPTLSPDGGFLPISSLWYPRVVNHEGLALHSWEVHLHLPTGQRGIVPGTLRHEEEGADGYRARFEFPHPGEGIDLMTGPYVINALPIHSVDGRQLMLRTYLHPEVADLSDAYLAAAGEQLAYHESQLGPYPFEQFSVVSSPTPTGFGMPTLTYLGIQVLRLPFIRSTSLGHEILHNWWGNGVYPQPGSGNWSEGLTTYLADYGRLRSQDPEEARHMRLNWLRELSAIPDGEALPLTRFTSRQHSLSQAVGYGKAAAVFAMLEQRIGTTAFMAGLRNFWHDHRFRSASWADLQHAFEHTHGASLNTFFEQWLQRGGLPSVALHSAQLEHTPEGTQLVIELRQSASVYELDVPVVVLDADGEPHSHSLRLDRAAQRFTVAAPQAAQEVVLDPDSLLLRRLSPDEAPPILREVQLGARMQLQLIGEAQRDPAFHAAATELAERLSPAADQHSRTDQRSTELWIGQTAELEAYLNESGLSRPAHFEQQRGDVFAWATRQSNGRVLMIVAADSAQALRQALRPLPHYGRYSWVTIHQGRMQARGTWASQAPRLTIQPVPR